MGRKVMVRRVVRNVSRGGLAILAWAFLAGRVGATRLPEPTAWMPSTASSIVYVDTTSLLSSSVFAGLEQVLSSQVGQSDLDEFRELTGMDPFRDFHALSFFTESPEDESERWGVAVSGAFDPERVIATLEERERVGRLQHRETSLYVVGRLERSPRSSDEPHALAFPDSGTALFGPLDAVRSMLDVGFGWAASADGGELEPALRSVSMGETFWFVASGEDTLGKELRAQMGEGAELPAVQALALSVRVGTDLSFRARGELSSAEEARKLADIVRGFAALGALSAGAGTKPPIDSLEVRELGAWLEVDFELDAERVREWLRAQEKKDESRGSLRRRPIRSRRWHNDAMGRHVGRTKGFTS